MIDLNTVTKNNTLDKINDIIKNDFGFDSVPYSKIIDVDQMFLSQALSLMKNPRINTKTVVVDFIRFIG